MTSTPDVSPASVKVAGPVPDKYAEALGYLLAKAAAKLVANAADQHAKALKSHRPDGSPLMGVGGREVVFLGTTQLGITRMDAGPTKVELDGTDPQVVAWVKNHAKYHDQIREIVEPAFVTKLKAHARKAGAPVAPTGEPIPGMTISVGDPKVVEQLVDDFTTVIAHALATGAISLTTLFALPTPTDPAIEEGLQR
ncbi:hypothetical protein ACFWYW_56805 [Nonomuraea sp. NPDC059023]|uniref:hypothetical protein n=1 Tax=unclassified Nonomuraea TaxID=2593643 RepID=UPI0036A50222